MKLPNFTNWKTNETMPEVKRQFICYDGEYSFDVCYILKDNGYMQTPFGTLGTTYWNIFKKHVKYWYYVDEIGKIEKDPIDDDRCFGASMDFTDN